MKVSVCVTVYNESKETIRRLLHALSNQSLIPNEVIVVDASKSSISNSQFPIFNEFTNFQFINKTGISRSAGRNLAIQKARNEIIAITDAGCVPYRDWLARLCSSFEKVEVKNLVVVGGYKMIANNDFEKAEAVFLGVAQKDMNPDFMPSARSMAFTKSIWKKADGFPEKLDNTAEDTLFNVELIKAGAKFVVAKNAVVDWQMPDTIKSFYLKIKNYAKGDAESGIWWHPVKKLKTHNLKVLTIFGRYFLAFVLLEIGYWYLFVYICIYLSFAYRKAGLWGIVLQFVSDLAAMSGFIAGLIRV